MFKLFKKKCPICKMKVDENSIQGFGKRFCSEECHEKYRKRLEKSKVKNKGGCCH